MIQVRSSVFETNSSSIHSICIARGSRLHPKDYESIDHLDISIGDFGWRFKKYDTAAARASYLYTLACDLDRGEEMKNRIFVLLGDLGIDVDFRNADDEEEYWYCHVDHAYEAEEFLNSMFHSDRLLIDFILCKRSCVFTGNDNEETPRKQAADEDSWLDKNPGGIMYCKMN